MWLVLKRLEVAGFRRSLTPIPAAGTTVRLTETRNSSRRSRRDHHWHFPFSEDATLGFHQLLQSPRQDFHPTCQSETECRFQPDLKTSHNRRSQRQALNRIEESSPVSALLFIPREHPAVTTFCEKLLLHSFSWIEYYVNHRPDSANHTYYASIKRQKPRPQNGCDRGFNVRIESISAPIRTLCEHRVVLR